MAADLSGVCEVTYKSLVPDRLIDAVDLLRAQGWKLHDATDFKLRCETGGYDCYIVAFDEQGILIGICGIFVQCDDHAYIGYVAVEENHRHKGIGGALIKHAQYKVANRNVILDTTYKNASFYSNLGFHAIHENWKIWFELQDVGDNRELPVNVEMITRESVPEIMAYDQTLHPFGYRKQMEVMFRDEGNIFLCAKRSAKVNGNVCGFLRAHPATQGVSLYADDPHIAELLLRGLLTSYPRHPSNTTMLYINPPPGNLNTIVSIFKRVGITSHDPIKYKRMATKGPPHGISWEKIYGTLNRACFIV